MIVLLATWHRTYFCIGSKPLPGFHQNQHSTIAQNLTLHISLQRYLFYSMIEYVFFMKTRTYSIHFPDDFNSLVFSPLLWNHYQIRPKKGVKNIQSHLASFMKCPATFISVSIRFDSHFTPRNVCMLHPHVGEVRSFIARLRAGWGGNMAHGVGQEINGWIPKMEVPFQPLWLLGEPAVNFQGCNQARAFPNTILTGSFGGWILMIVNLYTTCQAPTLCPLVLIHHMFFWPYFSYINHEGILMISWNMMYGCGNVKFLSSSEATSCHTKKLLTQPTCNMITFTKIRCVFFAKETNPSSSLKLSRKFTQKLKGKNPNNQLIKKISHQKNES